MTHKKTFPLWLSVAFLGVWILFSTAFNSAQFGDNFEQFNWAHSAQWGYWKHPPVSTWLLVGWQALFGFHSSNAYVLSFICLSLTLYFVWRIAQDLLPPGWAGLCVLLLSSHQMWTWRAQLYNHNVVLVMMVSACACLTVHLLRSPQARLWQWACLGLVAGLAVLTKYQAVVALAGLLLLMVLHALKHPRKLWLGLALAFVVFGLVLLPHVIWVYQTDFLIFKYATHSISGGPWQDRLMNLLSFSVQQLKYVALMLISLPVMKAFKVWRRQPSSLTPDVETSMDHSAIAHQHWLWGLLFLPVGVLVLLNQGWGVRLQNHWGMQLLLFLPLVLVWGVAQKAVQLDTRRMVGVYVCLQVLSLSLFVTTLHPAKPGDVDYPAPAIAATVMKTWREQTPCPLRSIAGPPFEAGMVSVYSGEYPMVIDGGDLLKSPWVSVEMLEKSGYVKMADDAAHLKDLGLVHQLPEKIRADFPKLQTLYWVNVLPMQACH